MRIICPYNIPVPGYEFTGEFRQAEPGEYYLQVTGPVPECAVRQRRGSTKSFIPFPILKKVAPDEVVFVKVSGGKRVPKVGEWVMGSDGSFRPVTVERPRTSTPEIVYERHENC